MLSLSLLSAILALASAAPLDHFNPASVNPSDVYYTTLYSDAIPFTTTLQPAPKVTSSRGAPPVVVPTSSSVAPLVVVPTSSSVAPIVVVPTSGSVAPLVVVPTSSSVAPPVVVFTSSSVAPPVLASSLSTLGTTLSTQMAIPAPSASSSEPAASPSPSAVTSIVPEAIVYSPYNNDGSCKSADAVYKDLQLIASKRIPSIRMYATNCNSLQTVQPAAQKLGLKINQGFWITPAGVDSIDNSVTDLINWGKQNGWDIFTMIIVGNEAVFSNYASWQELSKKITSVKAQLRAAGYQGPVGTAEPPVTFEKHPGLCTAGNLDFVGINAQSYFAPTFSAAQAGPFVKTQIRISQGLCPGLPIVVTETGYPSAGDVNGANVPSPENQALAIKSLMEELNGQCTILTTFNDFWESPGPYKIQQYFGVIQLFE